MCRAPEDRGPWWSEGLRFTCQGCGRCCRGEPGAIWFSPEEEGRLVTALGMDPASFRRRYVTRIWGAPSLRERPGGDCVLLDPDTGRCGVYAVRPLQCRTYPFWPSVVVSPESWRDHARRCPGMDQGRLWPGVVIARILTRFPPDF